MANVYKVHLAGHPAQAEEVEARTVVDAAREYLRARTTVQMDGDLRTVLVEKPSGRWRRVSFRVQTRMQLVVAGDVEFKHEGKLDPRVPEPQFA